MTFLSLDKRITLNPYIPRKPIPFEYMTDAEIMNGVGGTLIIDTETYINYFLIGMLDVKTNKVIRFEIKRKHNIHLDSEFVTHDGKFYDIRNFNTQKLSWIMHSYRTVGFNSLKYDLPLIWYAFLHQNNEVIKKLSDEIIFQNTWPKQLEKDYSFKIWPTQHVDLIEVCPLRGSLKLYGGRLHADRIQDLPFNVNGSLSSVPWKAIDGSESNQFDIVADYNLSDLFATKLLFNNLTEQLQLRTDLSREYKQDLMSKSDAQIAEAVIASELKRLTGKWPSKPKIDGQLFFNYKPPAFIQFLTPVLQKALQQICSIKYSLMDSGRLNKSDIDELKVQIGNDTYRMGSGGLHSSEKQLALKSSKTHKLKDYDVQSFYPAIILNCKLYPQHLGEAFLQIYKALVDSRIADKKAGRIAQSEVKKITINGTFGKLGSPYSILYSPSLMIQVTVTGQLALLMLIEKLELSGIQVVSANTDGILTFSDKSCNDIIKLWEQHTGFVTEETEYDQYYARDCNNYIAIEKNKNG